MRKKIIALMLILVFIITILQGCSKNEEQAGGQKKGQDKAVIKEEGQKNAEAEMGRFMEKKVEFPKLKKDEKVVKILQGSGNQIELYTYLDYNYKCYRLKEDMTWEKGKAGWLNTGMLIADYIELRALCYGSDGNYYACYFDKSDKKSHIIKSKDGKTSQEISIPFLGKAQLSKNNDTYYPEIKDLRVLENGNLVLNDIRDESSLLIFSPEGKKLDKIVISSQDYHTNFITSGNNIIAASQDKKSIFLYNTVKKELEVTADYDVKSGTMAYAQKKDGTILMGDMSGIHRLSKDGTLWETMVDGTLNSMSMPSVHFNELYVTEGEEEYYVSYNVNNSEFNDEFSNDGSSNDGSSNDGFMLMHYVYDKNISSVPSHVISVYSLQENNTIRQAISLYQSKYPDVKVDYTVAMGEEGGAVSDYIRALNTELLAGSGADILILDGLPVDSYLEKGVLTDISDIIKPLKDSGKILSNIVDCFNKKDKLYQIPLRFSVPMIVGNEDAVSSVNNLKSILSYIQNSNEKPYTYSLTYKELLQNNLALYSKEFYKDGEFDREQLVSFLNNLNQIAKNIKATEISEDASVTEEGFVDSSRLFEDKKYRILGLVSNKFLTGTTLASSFATIMVPNAIKNTRSLEMSTINNSFIPRGMIGLNSSSKEMDLAKQFITYLLSSKVQDTDLFDGFPVNNHSLKKWASVEINHPGFQWGFRETNDEGDEVSGTWPLKPERDIIVKMLSKLTTPIEMNQVINNIIIDEALPFLKGDIDADQAASAAASKISTYLAE